MSFISDAFAADEVPPSSAPGSATVGVTGAETVPYELSAEKMMMDNFVILGVLFFILYFLLIRPQQKRFKEHQAMMKALKKGVKVITSGGIIGVITKLEGDDIVVVEIAQGVRVRVAKSSISEITDDKSAGGESANDN